MLQTWVRGWLNMLKQEGREGATSRLCRLGKPPEMELILHSVQMAGRQRWPPVYPLAPSSSYEMWVQPAIKEHEQKWTELSCWTYTSFLSTTTVPRTVASNLWTSSQPKVLKPKDQWSWKPWNSSATKKMSSLVKKSESNILLQRIIMLINNLKLPWQGALSMSESLRITPIYQYWWCRKMSFSQRWAGGYSQKKRRGCGLLIHKLWQRGRHRTKKADHTRDLRQT